MKILRILGAVFGMALLTGMFSCGGSSYLSEAPLSDDTMSTATFEAGGGTQRYSASISAKDITLTHVEGDATGSSGDSFLDAGLHYCFFEFDSATLPGGHIQIESSAAGCSGIVNCGYCEATQVDYPDCEISCTLNTTAHSGLVGEYLEIRYVDKLITYSDAAGSSGGALRIEGEILDSINGFNLFDSTTRDFTIVDGGMVLDQVTPLTDASTVEQFDYAMEITDMILDPTASSHNPSLPDNVAWSDIESRVTAQLDISGLAVPSTTLDLDAGHYVSNAGFWHDAANEHDILAFVEMFGETLEFNEAGITNYANCTTVGENLGNDTICLGIDTSRTADAVAELVPIDTATDSTFNTYSEITMNSTECAAVDGTLGSEIDSENLPDICLPNAFAEVYDQNPLTEYLYGPTLDMFDPAVAGDDLTFAQAGVHHVCEPTEGNGCHPDDAAGEWSTCLPYLINDVDPAPDGCLSLCIDITGLGPPSVGGSAMTDYIFNLGLDDDQATCEGGGGVWLENDSMCLPTQMMACWEQEPEEYRREDTYHSINVDPFGDDEPKLASMATIFSHGSDAQNNGAADFIWNVDKTMYQYQIDCVNNHADVNARLLAVPYERNTDSMSTNPIADATCINVAQRFVSTTINPGDPGTDKALTPYNLSIQYEDRGFATQGLVIRILDGSNSGLGTPVFEDISGAYITGDATKIPASGLTNGAGQWFNVDIRVTLQQNPLLPDLGNENNWMSVYTDDGLTKDGESWIKVSTHFDFHRINEANLFPSDTGKNIYLMMIDLMAPIDAAGDDAGFGCDFSQQFVIDGTCVEDLP